MLWLSFTFILLSSLTAVNGDVLSLNEANYLEATKGKTVFIKFFAPWCGHCQAMAPDWEQLAAEWEGHAVGLVAEVDCTVSEVLCQEFEVGGYPTLMFGDPSAPESYEGDRDFESMSDFAKENLVKVFCSVHNTDGCTDEQKKAIADLEAKPIDELKETLSKIESDAEEEEARFNAETEKLQEHYEKLVTEYNAKVDEIRVASNYKLLRAVVNKKEDESVKTEL